jgi:hypothetical protein
MEKQEYITHQEGNSDGWICRCKNTPVDAGFYPCDEKGNEVEPIEGWGWLYACDRCGRIIDGITLEIVGQRQGVDLPHGRRIGR